MKASLRGLLALTPAALILVSAPLTPAEDLFLEIEGIEGESTDDRHGGAIEVLSFAWGMTGPPGAAAGGGAATRATFNDLVITANLDKASPLLSVYCAMGRPIPRVILAVRRLPTDPHDAYTITLTGALITSVRVGNDDALGAFRQSLTISYETIDWEFRPAPPPEGPAPGPTVGGWDLISNTRRR